MAQYLTIARPYAVALFGANRLHLDKLAAWGRVLQALSIVVRETTLLQCVLDPKIKKTALKTLLQESIKSILPEETLLLAKRLMNFLDLLIENKRLNTLPDIQVIFKRLLSEQQHLLNVEVTSAFELDENQLEALKKALQKRFNKEIAISFSVDTRLMGGAVIRTDEFVIDGSIRDRLNRLYHSLHS